MENLKKDVQMITKKIIEIILFIMLLIIIALIGSTYKEFNDRDDQPIPVRIPLTQLPLNTLPL